MISPPSPRRIMVYGVTGAGKTTLARQLSQRLDLPWHSIDDLTFEPNWVAVSPEELRLRIGKICNEEEWIIDTAYGMWLDIPLERVELIVGLDYPRWLSLSRLVRRTILRLFDRRTICNGNRESVRTMFSSDSIIAWHFKSFDRKHDRIVKWSTAASGPAVLRFRHPRKVNRWLRGLG